MLLFLFSRKKTDHKPLAELPFVSLIIAAHNEADVIGKKIDNALSMDYPKDKFEVLVASDNSDDATVVCAQRSSGPIVRVLDFKERRGKLGTLNEAVKHARGSVLMFTDANAMFAKDALQQLLLPFSDPMVGCVSGQKIIRSSGATDAGEGLYWRIESFIKKRESYRGSCAGADGAVYAVRKELYPFPPTNKLFMDDFFISLAIIQKGFRCIYNEQAKAYEESSDNFRSELRRKGRILAGAINVLFKMPGLLIPFYSSLAIKLWSHKVLRWAGGVFLAVALGMNIYLYDLRIYKLFLYPHVLFYGLGIIGLFLSTRNIKIFFFYYPYYFLFMNYSQVLGLWTWLKEGRKSHWERIGR
jgi:cellulose synthase/poly-beta-1,6-N-acetylglucosamine synthase-like glycosyltransferase